MNASIENYLKVYKAEALSWFTALLFLPFNPMVFYSIIAAQTLALSEVFYVWKNGVIPIVLLFYSIYCSFVNLFLATFCYLFPF